MARTIKEIYNEIIQEKQSLTSLNELGYTGENADTLLTNLNSGSKVAAWRLWAFVVAASMYFHEKLWDVFRAEVEERLKGISGTDEWLANECRKFQYGDELLFDTTSRSYYYAVEDSNKQIVKRVAISESFGTTTVKVATVDNDGDVVALSAQQQNSLSGYLDLIQYAGASLNVVSQQGDQIDLKMEVYYSPLATLAAVQSDVEAKIDEYLSNLEFNGTFRVLNLIDAIQSVEEVIDLRLDHIKTAAVGADLEPVTRIYLPISGYFSIADKSSITYKPEA